MLHCCRNFDIVETPEKEIRIVCQTCGRVVRRFIDTQRKVYPKGHLETSYSQQTLESLV